MKKKNSVIDNTNSSHDFEIDIVDLLCDSCGRKYSPNDIVLTIDVKSSDLATKYKQEIENEYGKLQFGICYKCFLKSSGVKPKQ